MTKITFQEHQLIGLIGKILQKKLLNEGCNIANAEKTKAQGNKKSIRYFKAEKELSKLRDNLEEIMFKDYPQSTTNIYYGDRLEYEDIIIEVKKLLEAEE